MKTFGSFVLGILALGLCANLALAHGGEYLGPGGGGTGGYAGPGGGGETSGPDPGGGPAGGGGTTPGPGGGGGTTPNPGGPPVRPGGAPRGGAGTGGRTTPGIKAKGDSNQFLDWDWWWDLNDDRFLLLKSKVRSAEAASTSRDKFLGEDEGDNVVPVSTARIRKEIMPALKAGLKDPYYDARAGAVIAYGKVADKSDPEALDTLRKFLSDKDKIVQESTCLALGILGNKAALPDLLEVAKNTVSGRKLAGSGTGDVPTRMRAFAAVAIGLIGAREGFVGEEASILNELVSLASADAAHLDLRVGPALALQLVKSEKVAQDILALVKAESTDRFVRGHLAVALGKIGFRAAIPELRKLLKDKETYTNYGAAIALGLLANKEDKDVVKDLITYARKAPNPGTKNFAIMALGEIGDESGRAVLMELVQGGQVAERTFAALALGVIGTKNPSTVEESGQVVLDQYKKSKNEPEKSAYAIALGLLNYQKSLDVLRADLASGSGSQKLKSHICTALGLMNDKNSIPLIQELVAQKGDQDLRKRAAVALGLLRDPDAVNVLERVIQESKNTKAILGAATVALGYIGDTKAVPILARMVENPRGDVQDVTRAFATVALGFLGDKDDIPLLSRIHENSNYLANTEGVGELLSIL
jgi:HEAT repeat protein